MYLVTLPNHRPFFTTCFIAEIHWQEGMAVYHFPRDRHANYTTDGYNWHPVEFDSL